MPFLSLRMRVFISVSSLAARQHFAPLCCVDHFECAWSKYKKTAQTSRIARATNVMDIYKCAHITSEPSWRIECRRLQIAGSVWVNLDMLGSDHLCGVRVMACRTPINRSVWLFWVLCRAHNVNHTQNSFGWSRHAFAPMNENVVDPSHVCHFSIVCSIYNIFEIK